MSATKGVIAASSEPTARSGAALLEAGGNAVDAVVGACFATSAGEPALTSLAGGGVMVHRDGATGRATICDFFADAPGRCGSRDVTHMELDFGPTTQRFHIGPGTAAVPGTMPGLCAAHERWGRLPLREVLAPAMQHLQDGVVLDAMGGRVMDLLAPILSSERPCRAQFSVAGRLLREGDLYRCPALASTLAGLCAGDWREFLSDHLFPAIVSGFGPSSGGLIRDSDLEGYEVQFRKPLEVAYRGHRVLTNPPPAAGGTMIALMLELLGTVAMDEVRFLSTAHVRRLAWAMQLADRARRDPAAVEPWKTRFAELVELPLGEQPDGPGGPASTTHVSVVDGEGNCAAVTMSYGEGSGHLIGDTGIVMNNLLGEEDLLPEGLDSWTPGERLSTMMSPTLLLEPGGGVTVLGSGGANRIRTALVQVISNLVDHRDPALRAVAAPRVHFEAGVLNVETFETPGAECELASLAPRDLVCFSASNLFFGGVHVARRRADGALEGAGDPRRGGVCVRV